MRSRLLLPLQAGEHRLSRGRILYRSAWDRESALASGGFWTPSKKYALWIYGQRRPVFRARLQPGVRVFWPVDGCVEGWRFNALREQGHRVVAAPMVGDWKADEYVVFDPTVLRDVVQL